MTLDFRNARFDINLVEAALHELNFLDKVEKLKYLYENSIINEALRRYETLWLPLMKDYNGIYAAPIDIYWVWHVHMLCPVAYRQDLEQYLGKLIDHIFLTEEEYEKALTVVRALWCDRYPKESFETTDVKNQYQFVSNFSYDIQEAAKRQASFFYQVSLPHYRTKPFLERSLLRYQMFLALKRNNASECIVPCYDIDIMWHTHQLHPSIYARDTQNILGYVLPHDDSVNDRSPNSKLTQTDSITRNLWLTSYKEPFSMDGSMFRGDSSAGQMNDADLLYLYALRPKMIDLTVNFFTDLTRQFKYILKLYLMTHNTKDKCLCKYDYFTKTVEYNCDNFLFSTHENIGFKVKLFRKSRLCSNKLRFATQLSTYQDFDTFNSSTIGTKCCFKLEILLDKKVFDVVTIGFTPKSILVCENFLGLVIVGEFLMVSINITDPLLWGLTVKPDPGGLSTDGIMASHSIQNGSGKHVFDVNIIHSIKLNQSIVQVYSHDKVLAIGNLIGKEQLPLIDKVNTGTKYPFLKNKEKNRAMIIKDNYGDWAIVVANWNVNQTTFGSAGYFGMDLFCLRDKNRCIHLEIDKFDSVIFIVDDLFVNIATGQIELKSCANLALLPNYICLVFSISILYTLCKPRLIATMDSVSNSTDQFEYSNNINLSTEIKVIGKPMIKYCPPSINFKKVNKDDSVESQLLVAAGYHYDLYIPSNSFFKQCVDSGGCAGCVGFNSGSYIIQSSVIRKYTVASCRDGLGSFASECENDNESVEWD